MTSKDRSMDMFRYSLVIDRAREMRIALTKISDRTSERLRTKAELMDAIDAIGILAAEALAMTSGCSHCGKPADYAGPCGVGGCPLGLDI